MRLLTFIVLLLALHSCNWVLQPDMIGWIPFDPSIDNQAFQLCNEEKARRGEVRYPFYGEGKRDLKTYFMDKISPFVEKADEHGHIVIRFLVNCEGKAGRFRIEELGRDYKTRTFAAYIPQKLLEAVQEIEAWQLPEGMDGYGFITFKIQNGQLVDVI